MDGKTKEHLRKLYLEVEQAAQEKADKAIRNGGLTESEVDIFRTQDIIIQYLDWVHQARVAIDRNSRLKLEAAVEMIDAIEANNSRVEPVPDSRYFRHQLNVWNQERKANS